MRKTVYLIAAASVCLTAACIYLYRILKADAAYTFAVTFGTTAYHFLMRLAVGGTVNACMKNHADYTKSRYQCRSWETRLYKRLQVKHWKHRLPTFQPDLFDPKKHSWDEIVQAMCQAELVHEIIVILSFLPIGFAHWFGALPVFMITSLLAALTDLSFVILQRYNRPRIIRLMQKENTGRTQHAKCPKAE